MVYVLVLMVSGCVVAAARLGAVPLIGPYADLVLLVPVFWLWALGARRISWQLLLLTALLVDIASPQRFPVTLISSVVAGITYLTVVSPVLAYNTLFTRLISLSVWLLLWRLTRLAIFAAGWLTGILTPLPNHLTWYELPMWLLMGMLLWGGLVGGWSGLRHTNLFSRFSPGQYGEKA